MEQTTPESSSITAIDPIHLKLINKIENASEKGRVMILEKAGYEEIKRAFDNAQNLLERTIKAGIYDGIILKIGGEQIVLNSPAKFKAFLANGGNLDAINEAVKEVQGEPVATKEEAKSNQKEKTKADIKAKMAELDAKEEEIDKQILKGIGGLSINLNPKQVSLLAQLAWQNVKILVLENKITGDGITFQIKDSVNDAISEINNTLVSGGKQPINPSTDDILKIILEVEQLAFQSEQIEKDQNETQEVHRERKFEKSKENKVVPQEVIVFYKAVYKNVFKIFKLIMQKMGDRNTFLHMVVKIITNVNAINRILGFILITPAVISVITFVLHLLVDENRMPVLTRFSEIQTNEDGTIDFSQSHGVFFHELWFGYMWYPASSTTPFFIGLLAIAGVYLLKEKK